MGDSSDAIRNVQRKGKANKLCAECGERGPGYVCLTHATFVCTTCSGILREFNVRVKGISASTFSPEEVQLMKDGGNSKAHKLWLSEFDEDSFSLPQPQESDKIRRFLKLKYQEGRWKKGAKKPTKKKQVSSSSSDSTDSEQERIRAKKKKALKKKTHKKKVESSSSEDQVPRPKDIKDIIPNAPKLVVSKKSPKVTKPEPETDLFGDWTDFASATQEVPPLAVQQVVDPFADLFISTPSGNDTSSLLQDINSQNTTMPNVAAAFVPEQPFTPPQVPVFHNQSNLSQPSITSVETAFQPQNGMYHQQQYTMNKQPPNMMNNQQHPGMMNQQQPNMMNQQQPNMMNQQQPNMMNQQQHSMKNQSQNMTNQQQHSMMNQSQNMMNQQQPNMMNLQQHSMMNQPQNMMNQQQPNMMNQQQHSMMNQSQNIMNQQQPSITNQQQQRAPQQQEKPKPEGNPFDMF